MRICQTSNSSIGWFHAAIVTWCSLMLWSNTLATSILKFVMMLSRHDSRVLLIRVGLSTIKYFGSFWKSILFEQDFFLFNCHQLFNKCKSCKSMILKASFLFQLINDVFFFWFHFNEDCLNKSVWFCASLSSDIERKSETNIFSLLAAEGKTVFKS